MGLNLPALAAITSLTIVSQPNNPNQYLVRECVESSKGDFCRQTKVEIREDLSEVLKKTLTDKKEPKPPSKDPLKSPNNQPANVPVRTEPAIIRKEDEITEIIEDEANKPSGENPVYTTKRTKTENPTLKRTASYGIPQHLRTAHKSHKAPYFG